MVTNSTLGAEIVENFLHLLVATSVASIILNLGIQRGDPLYPTKVAISNSFPMVIGLILAVPTVSFAILEIINDEF